MENIIKNNNSNENKNNIVDREELEQYFANALQTYIDLRAIPHPYYNFQTLDDKWREYDRCYRIEAKANREDYEYNGFSNIVTPDFHESIEIKKSKEIKALFGGADLFTTEATKFSTLQDAMLARRLVEYSMNRVSNFQAENAKVILDRRKYGTAFVYMPYKVEERYVNTVSLPIKKDEKTGDIKVDKNNQIVMDDKLNDFEIIEEVKYTDFKHIPTRDVYLNPNIEDIQSQECVFVRMTYSYYDLINMEKDGIIDEGMADYVVENYKDYSSETGGDNDIKTNEESYSFYDKRLRSFDLYLVYKRVYLDNGDCVLYECIYMWKDKILGMREYPKNKIPIRKTCFIPIAGSAYGLGQGDQIYPLYVAMCARINQVFDLETKEIKGGGFKDAEALPDKVMKTWKPGQWISVAGLSARLANNGRPVLTMAELEGSRPASTALDIVPMLERKLRSGSGATDVLSGQPTHSQVDRTAAGLTLIAEQAEDRLGSELLIYQEEILKEYAIEAYDNYCRFLIPEVDLPRMFDKEDLFYIDELGNQRPITIDGMLRNVNFVFLAANRVIDREEKIGKIQRFLQIMMNIVSVAPSLGQLVLEKINFIYLIQSIADALDITDLDRLFPQFNPIGELVKERVVSEQLATENNMLKQGIQMVINKLQEIGDQSGLDVIDKVMEQMQVLAMEASKQNNA